MTKCFKSNSRKRCATHFEAYFVMLPLPQINLPSVGACSTTAESFFPPCIHLYSHTLHVDHQAFYLPANEGIIVAGQEKYLAFPHLSLSSPAEPHTRRLKTITDTGYQFTSLPKDNSSWPVKR